MQQFLWNPAWETGVKEIDEQHHELFRRMGELALSLSSGREQTETGKVLIYLRQYVDFHFAAEESSMQKADYPGLVTHKSIHDSMREQVNALVEAYLADPQAVPNNLMEFLVTWLVTHIDKEDMAMASFLKRLPSH